MPANYAERADAYLYGLLSPEEAAAFEQQLGSDPELNAALDTARRRRAMLEAALPPAEASELLVRTTLDRIDEHTQNVRRWRRWVYGLMFAPLAAGLLMVAFFQLRYYGLSANPVNLEVFGQNTLIAGSRSALRVRLTDKFTQNPLAGVAVEVTLGEPGSANFTTLARFNTDERGSGSPEVVLPEWADCSYPLRITAQDPHSA